MRIIAVETRVSKREEEPMRAFEDRSRTRETLPRQKSGLQPGLCGPARMEPLGPGAFRQVFDYPGGKAAGDSKGLGYLCGGHPQRRGTGASTTE